MSKSSIPRERRGPFNTALTIAGSDSGGGAGIQADLKAFFALGIHGTSVITAVTAQNTRGVSAWQPVEYGLVLQQLEAILSDLPPRAIKTGMLAEGGLAKALGKRLGQLDIPLVVDPVLVATAGDALAASDMLDAMVSHLLPVATLVTPNLPEAEALTGFTIRTKADRLHAARKLLEMGSQAVLLKGGHGSAGTVEDLLLTREGEREFRHARRDGQFHGTGCTLSAAITARLALGDNLTEAIERGIDLVLQSMDRAVTSRAGSLKILRLP